MVCSWLGESLLARRCPPCASCCGSDGPASFSPRATRATASAVWLAPGGETAYLPLCTQGKSSGFRRMRPDRDVRLALTSPAWRACVAGRDHQCHSVGDQRICWTPGPVPQDVSAVMTSSPVRCARARHRRSPRARPSPRRQRLAAHSASSADTGSRLSPEASRSARLSSQSPPAASTF